MKTKQVVIHRNKVVKACDSWLEAEQLQSQLEGSCIEEIEFFENKLEAWSADR